MNVPTLLLCLLLAALFGLAIRYLCKSGSCAGCSQCKAGAKSAKPPACSGCCAHCLGEGRTPPQHPPRTP